MKNYQEVLKIVSKKNPELSYRDAQIQASNIYNEQKDLEPATIDPKKEPKQMVFNGDLDPDVIEAKIRAAGVVSIHSMLETAKNYSPHFTLVKGNKVGVNREVWLEGPVRVPRNSNFKVFLI